ncbi:N-6 DNA methylase [Pedobacter jeongneungensis]|uniref:N-6 DNA methylase n=1 Tax=Pedobacter jeongneungensis TaxID=947309 RepID=UPI000469B495|nr:N-6 DNA methylase [Pedobacter jeongneungensis]
MSEELLQRDLIKNAEKIGKWDFYNIGATSIRALKGFGIIRNVDYGSIENKKVDGIIVLKKNVIAIIEYKTPASFKTKAQQDKAIKQELEVAKKLDCKILIATDTKDAVWVNALTGERIKDEDGKELKTLFDPKSDKIADLIEKVSFSINEINNDIKPKKLVNPTDLARQIWQDIWSVSGATPENCLYTFVELFIFKYLSDLGVLSGFYNFNTVMASFETNSADEILENYASIIRPKIKELFPENPVDKTTIINGTIFVSKDQKAVKGYSTVFKKVLLKFKEYGKLEHIDYDFKSQLFESFLKESISKKNWGQFFTPLKVVRAIVEMAKDEIKDGVKICDPACGVGKFLLEPIVTKLDYLYDINKTGIVPKITIHGYDKGFDKDEQKTIILAKANMLIYFSDLIKENPGLTKEFAQLFNQSFILKTNSILGTLSDAVEDEYDLILTNPPYVTSGSSNLKEEIKKDGDLANYYKVSALGVEGLFMEWIVKALKPNGKAYIVVPDGLLNRQNDKNLREFILQECYIDGIISLPLNTFFTTNKKTYIFCITRKADKKHIQTDPVFSYLVSEIGETRDVYRFEIDQNDLSEGVALYSFFKGNKAGFERFNTDKRCKVIPFNFFSENVNENWVIDKLWTTEEKINLGISEKTANVSLFEFSSIIEDTAITIKGLQEEVKELAEKKKSELIFKDFKLDELFDIERGLSKFTRKYGDVNKGDFPVYSASNKEALTSVNSYQYDGEFLTWATNGFAGFMKIIDGKFSINGDRGLLKPRVENINIHYVKHKIEPILRGMAKGRKGENGEDEFTKVYPSMIKDLLIEMPVMADQLDIEAQLELVEKINTIANINEKVYQYEQKFAELKISLANDFRSKEFTLAEILNLQDGFAFPSSVYTKQSRDIKLIRIQDVNGKSEPKNVRIPKDYMFSNKEKFIVKKGDYLLSLSGAAGFNLIKWTGEDGYLNQRITKLTFKSEFQPKFIEDYQESIIEQVYDELNSLGNSANNNLSRKDISRIKINIPISEDGEIDKAAQVEILNIQRRIAVVKTSIVDELQKIRVPIVSLD